MLTWERSHVLKRRSSSLTGRSRVKKIGSERRATEPVLIMLRDLLELLNLPFVSPGEAWSFTKLTAIMFAVIACAIILYGVIAIVFHLH